VVELATKNQSTVEWDMISLDSSVYRLSTILHTLVIKISLNTLLLLQTNSVINTEDYVTKMQITTGRNVPSKTFVTQIIPIHVIEEVLDAVLDTSLEPQVSKATIVAHSGNIMMNKKKIVLSVMVLV
jgi:hypothetical protein